MSGPSIVLFRRDLRVEDNPALSTAMANGATLAVFVLDDEADGRPLGGAARWWLHHALLRLRARLTDLGVPLILRQGRQNEEVMQIVKADRAAAVYWNRRYTPWGISADRALVGRLQANGILARSHSGAYLREPWEVLSKRGTWLKVFTPFYRASLKMGEPRQPAEIPSRQSPQSATARSERLSALDLTPKAPDWAGGLRKAWLGDHATAAERLASFLDSAVGHYGRDRDRPDLDGTSALSPYLAFGELSPRQLWHAARRAQISDAVPHDSVEAFLRQLVWRDFCANLLYHYPDLATKPFQPKFDRFPWADDPARLRAWQSFRVRCQADPGVG